MGKRDKKVDAYISKSEDFAKPILKKLRDAVHKACPEVEENWKWSFPHFDYKGIFCSMAAFKHHCSFGFWKASAMKDPYGVLLGTGESGMGHLGKITSLKDLPSEKILISLIKQAKKLNDEGVKNPARIPKPKKELVIPDYFLKAVKKNKKALATFEAFSTSKKREYVEWITEAKTDTTRERRLKTAVEWMAEGKARNWKYENC